MSRIAVAARAALCAALVLAAPARAQNAESDADRRVMDAVRLQARAVDLTPPECRPENRRPGSIVVCGDPEGNEKFRAPLRAAAEAQQTGDGVPRAPDLAGGGIFSGPATVSGLCALPPCPKGPVYFVDFDALPDPPPGSEAYRRSGDVEPPPAP